MIEKAYINESRATKESRNPAELPVIYWNGEAKFIPGEKGSIHKTSEELGFKTTSKMMEYLDHRIIQFNLKTHPWESIEDGEKQEEYRELNFRWCKRMFLFAGGELSNKEWSDFIKNESIHEVKKLLSEGIIKPKNYKSICFVKGYPKKGEFEIWKKFKGVEIKKPNPNWTFGIVPQEEVIAIKF